MIPLRTSTLLIAAALSLRPAPAQQLDTAGFGQKNAPSLLDNAESASERKAFATLLEARDPGKKRSLALDFAARFPSSWLLATAWQMAAAASVDLNDQPAVITWGSRSLALLPENPLLLIALARAEVLQGDKKNAALHAKDALVWLSVLSGPPAVPPEQWDATRRSLEDYARRIAAPADPKAPPSPPAHRPGFAGSASCRTCHQAIYQSWRETGMAKMLRPLSETRLLADFSQPGNIPDDANRPAARIGADPQPFFEFLQPGGTWKRFPVDYTIGSRWQQAYATSLPDGRFFVFPLQFNTLTGKWLNYWQLIDPPASQRSLVSRFPDLAETTSYQRNCAVCHTSQLRLTRAGDSSMEHAAFREPGVNCEMCHGPSAGHVEDMTAGIPFRGAGANPPFRFAAMDHVDATLVCGQCHRQSAVRTLGKDGAMNFTLESPGFPRLPAAASAASNPRAVYKDGRYRETTFIGEAFMRSACFLRGNAQCASCHNPHPADPLSNPVSLRFPRVPDRMCLQCHRSLEGNIARHTRHPESSPGSRCAACHMPPIMNALLFRAASHQISDIPRAETVARFGPGQSPNACLICHKDKNADWLKDRLNDYRQP